jgi:hypothetical protein
VGFGIHRVDLRHHARASRGVVLGFVFAEHGQPQQERC